MLPDQTNQQTTIPDSIHSETSGFPSTEPVTSPHTIPSDIPTETDVPDRMPTGDTPTETDVSDNISESTGNPDDSPETELTERHSEEQEPSQEPMQESSVDDTEETVRLPHIVYDMVGVGMAAMIVLLLVMTFFCRQVTVDGASMNDTLQHEDRLFVSCFDYHPQNGDIVVVTHGKDLDEPIIKRVIATGGQRLRINYHTGEVTVDGVLLHEPYILGTTRNVMTPTEIPDVIPEGYVFVMGDNRQNSLDSRSAKVDLVPEENIIGKAVFRIYPFDSFGVLS